MNWRKLFSGKDWALMWPFYTMTFVYAVASLATPFLVVFLQQKEFVLSQVALLFIAQRVGTILFEIPTGIIADLYGRKFSALLGESLVAALWMTLPFLPNFSSTLIVFFLIGVFFTLISGAEEAWAYDWMKFNKSEKLVKTFYAKSQALNSIGYIIGPLFAAVIAARANLLWLFVVNGIVGLSLVLFMALFQGEHFVKHHDTEKKVKQMLRTGGTGLAFFKNIPYTLFVVGGLSYAFGFAPFEIAEQPFLIELGAPLPMLGVFFSILALLFTFAPLLGLALSKRYDDINIIFITSLLSFALLLPLFFIPKPYWIFGMILLVISPFVDGISQPIYSAELQRLIPSNIRATVSSIRSMIQSLISILGLYLVGRVIDIFETRYAFLLVVPAMILLPVFLIYKRIRPKGYAK